MGLIMTRLTQFTGGVLAAVLCLLLGAPAAMAVSAQDFPLSLPEEVVLDAAEVLSRASRNEISSRLKELDQFHVDARLVTLRRLDYGLSLPAFGEELLQRWDQDSKLSDRPLLIFWRKPRASRPPLLPLPPCWSSYLNPSCAAPAGPP